MERSDALLTRSTYVNGWMDGWMDDGDREVRRDVIECSLFDGKDNVLLRNGVVRVSVED